MIQTVNDGQRSAFSWWLRTGKLPVVRTSDGIELKFNPWHDSEDGRFTFAGNGRYFGRSGGSDGAVDYRPSINSPSKSNRSETPSASNGRFAHAPRGVGGVFGRQTGARPIDITGAEIDERLPQAGDIASSVANQARPPARPGPAVGRGSNSRAFEDPMTLEQSFPGLRNAPGGAVIAVADNLFDLTGPANAMTTEVLQSQAQQLMAQIKAIDSTWHYDEIVPTDALGNPVPTIQGLTSKVNDLRFRRAAMIAQARGDYESLQVETLRFVQQRTDDAYNRGVALLKAGRLTPRLSDQEALGNYVDRQVRLNLRDRYNQLGIDSAGAGPVRVNRRENNSSGSELTYRRPDARVKDVAFDVTLTRKTSGTAQVRGFFDADFRPSRVIIIRPRQLGANHTYAIPRSETQR